MNRFWIRCAAPLGVVVALSGCADRLENVGRPPVITAPGAPIEAIAPIVDQRRVAMATPRAAPAQESYAVASLWRSGPSSLFGDRRARGTGDILTVVIEIEDEAAIENSSERSRGAGEDMSVNSLLGVDDFITRAIPEIEPSIGLSSSSSSNGSGSVSRSESITLRVAATVTDVLPNGHLVISGNQEIRVNFELRDLQVAGIVRPEDISRRNEITYDKIADARVAYGGRGQITDVQQPRYAQQVLDIVAPF